MPERERWACRNCRRPIHWLPEAGWLHGELPQYAHEPIACTNAYPVCEYRACDHGDGPDPACACRCHTPGSPPRPKEQHHA